MKSNVHKGEKKKIANVKDPAMGFELVVTTLDKDVGVITDSAANMPAWCSVAVKKTLKL